MTKKLVTSISISPELYHDSRVYMAQKKYRSFSELVEVAVKKIMETDPSK